MEQLSEAEALAARAMARRVIAQVEQVIVGKRELVELVTLALLARGHVLIEDIPGVGKTTLAKAMARAVGGSFKRLQFTPDLLPGDVTGLTVYNQKSGEFAFNAGPIFANVVLADEINRATPKTQSALLEAMEEAQVTVDGQTRPLPQPFFVLATQNPIEYRGTYPLPEAQMDRFLMRLSMGYPRFQEEVEMLLRHHEAGPDTAPATTYATPQLTLASNAGQNNSRNGQAAILAHPNRIAANALNANALNANALNALNANATNANANSMVNAGDDGDANGEKSDAGMGEAGTSQSAALLEQVEAVLSVEDARRLQRDRMRVFVSGAIREYIVAITHGTRGDFGVALGVSPRGSLALQRAAQAAAIMEGRAFVLPDDVKRLVLPVLGHRIIMQGNESRDHSGAQALLQRLIDETPVPSMPA